MRCARQSMTLSVNGCAKLWRSAQEDEPKPWEGRWHCRTCPIGAAHNGQSPREIEAATTAAALAPWCPRCVRVSDRIINGDLCISCYNRAREAERGRNAKGGTPRLAAVLHAETVAAVAPGAAPARVTFASVASRAEALIRAAKRAAGPVAFGLCSSFAPPPGWQYELGL